jgi:hypothetical protein
MIRNQLGMLFLAMSEICAWLLLNRLLLKAVWDDVW